LLEFSQLRHTRLKFTNGRLAVVTADDRTRFEGMPDHALGPRPIGDGAAVFGKRRIWPSCRQQSDKGKDQRTEAWSERRARDPPSVRTLTRYMNGIRRHRGQSIFGLSSCCDRAELMFALVMTLKATAPAVKAAKSTAAPVKPTEPTAPAVKPTASTPLANAETSVTTQSALTATLVARMPIVLFFMAHSHSYYYLRRAHRKFALHAARHTRKTAFHCPKFHHVWLRSF
jgi:hypothetical protein